MTNIPQLKLHTIDHKLKTQNMNELMIFPLSINQQSVLSFACADRLLTRKHMHLINNLALTLFNNTEEDTAALLIRACTIQ